MKMKSKILRKKNHRTLSHQDICHREVAVFAWTCKPKPIENTRKINNIELHLKSMSILCP